MALGPHILKSRPPRLGLPKRGRTLLGLAVVMTVLSASVPSAWATSSSSSGPTATVPVSAMNGWALYPLSPSQLDSQLAEMHASGVKLLRIDASWAQIEPAAPDQSGHHYRFDGYDYGVAAMARRGIRWLPILDYSAPWAATQPGDWRSPPADDSQFAAYAAAVAHRYGPGGTFWKLNPQLPYEPVQTLEVWNEENTTYFWGTEPNPAAYARLYLATRNAIKALDPNAQVIVGGLTNPLVGISALTYVRAMFQAEPSLASSLDGIGLHPYAANASGVIANVVAMRNLLIAHGAGATPIDVTEFGWKTGDGRHEAARAATMTSVAQALGNSNCGVGLLAPFDWMNPTRGSGDDWGLANRNGLRPAGTAWFSGLGSVAASSPHHLCAAATPTPAATATRRRAHRH